MADSPRGGKTNALTKTALHQAVVDGRVHQVRLLVSMQSIAVDCRDYNGRTPLMLACMLDNEETGIRMVRILLRAGAYTNLKDGFGRTPLTYACMKGRERIVAKILKEDVLGVNEADNDGNSPLNYGAISGNPRIVQMLVDVLMRFGLQVDVRNKMGYTGLLLAAKYGHYVTAHILLTQGQASPLIRDNEFSLTAAEWANRSHEMRAQQVHNALQKTSFPRSGAVGIGRETTMYQRMSPICRHVRPPLDPFNPTLEGALSLPPIRADDRNYFDSMEEFLEKFEELSPQKDSRPSSNQSSQSTLKIHPSSAKLMAFTSRSHRRMNPDLTTIFDLYSEQYQYMLPPNRLQASAKKAGSRYSAAPSSHHYQLTGQLAQVDDNAGTTNKRHSIQVT